MSYAIEKHEVDAALFEFLRSIYHFEHRESVMFDVTWDEVYLLHLLIRFPDIRVSDLSKRMQLANFATSRMVTRLEKAGYVHKSHHDNDKRVVILQITDEGRAKVEAIEQYNYEVVAAHFNTMPEDTLRSLLGAISKLGTLLNVESEEEKS